MTDAEKIRIAVLGSGSGTEPYPGRHHTSWLLAAGDSLYFFDAGENCAHAAVTAGFDLRQIRAIFLSHPHIDHTGGLPHLIFTCGKLNVLQGVRLKMTDFPPVYTPWVPAVTAAATLNFFGEPDRRPEEYPAFPVTDGVIYHDEHLQVTAKHNRHLGIPADGVWRSFSYRIACGGRNIVFSGDLAKSEEILEWYPDCELLLMETGHHDPLDVCRLVLAQPESGRPRRLVFLHHGRRFLDRPEIYVPEVKRLLGDRVVVASDGFMLEL